MLVALFGLGLATFSPGTAHAEGEAVAGTLQTSRSGPIEGVEVTVTDAAGDEIEQVESDEDGRWSVDLPGPGEYTVTIDSEALPEGIGISGEDSRTVTVDEGRRQPVAFSLTDGSRGAGSGGVLASEAPVVAEIVTPSPAPSGPVRVTRWPGSTTWIGHETCEPAGPVVQAAAFSSVGAVTCTSTFCTGARQGVPTAFQASRPSPTTTSTV